MYLEIAHNYPINNEKGMYTDSLFIVDGILNCVSQVVAWITIFFKPGYPLQFTSSSVMYIVICETFHYDYYSYPIISWITFRKIMGKYIAALILDFVHCGRCYWIVTLTKFPLLQLQNVLILLYIYSINIVLYIFILYIALIL